MQLFLLVFILGNIIMAYFVSLTQLFKKSNERKISSGHTFCDFSNQTLEPVHRQSQAIRCVDRGSRENISSVWPKTINNPPLSPAFTSHLSPTPPAPYPFWGVIDERGSLFVGSYIKNMQRSRVCSATSQKWIYKQIENKCSDKPCGTVFDLIFSQPRNK